VYKAYLACNSKVDCIEGSIGRCSKCEMNQLYDMCKSEAYAKLLMNVGTECVQLSAFKCVLVVIVDGKEIAVPNLLTAKTFTCVHDNVIISVSRISE